MNRKGVHFTQVEMNRKGVHFTQVEMAKKKEPFYPAGAKRSAWNGNQQPFIAKPSLKTLLEGDFKSIFYSNKVLEKSLYEQ